LNYIVISTIVCNNTIEWPSKLSHRRANPIEPLFLRNTHNIKGTLSLSFSNTCQSIISHISAILLPIKKTLMPFYSSCNSSSNDIKDHVTEKWMPGTMTMKAGSAKKKVLSFISSYIVSSLTYNKTFYH